MIKAGFVIPLMTVLLLFIFPLLLEASDQQRLGLTPILKFWDYGNPDVSEERFRQLLQNSENPHDKALIHTQIARTFSLRGEFSKANTSLAEAIKLIEEDQSDEMALYLLEKGRTFNSSGDKESALTLFQRAWETARITGNDYIAVDAAHMAAIAANLEDQMQWHMKALLLAEASESPEAGNWLGSLYNNIGWTYFNEEQYDKALSMFQKAVEFRRTRGDREKLWIAKWMVARTYRAMGRLDAALIIQQQLEKEQILAGLTPDAYVYEELAELYFKKSDGRAGSYFELAYEALSKDEWLVKNEPERVDRLRKMSREQVSPD